MDAGSGGLLFGLAHLLKEFADGTLALFLFVDFGARGEGA